MLTIPLHSEINVPLYEQIYSYIKNEISEGSLKEGEKLPSSRSLAAHLSVSRNTVNFAYDQLVSEGYLEARKKSGYYVCNIEPLRKLSAEKSTSEVKTQEEKKDSPAPSCRYDFSPFTIDLSSFPFSVWRKLSKDCMHNINQELFLLGDNKGDLRLRLAISKYLHDSRGVNCDANRIIVGAGMDYLLQLLTVLLKEKAPLAMETPAYLRAYRILSGAGHPIRPIPVTSSGMDISALKASDASYVYVTPSHQYPSGAVMGATKRHELLSWAAKDFHRYIIEDDHDSEFRYRGKPIPALQGLDENGSVIYLGTFSRSIAPAIRVAYMVLPERLLPRYEACCSFYSNTVSRIDQTILSDFLENGHFERHVNKMRKIYHAKHDLMLQALSEFGSLIRISGSNAGLHLVVEIKTTLSEAEVIKRANEAGVRIYGLSAHDITPVYRRYPVFLLGFANLTPEDIKNGIHTLYSALFT